MQHNDACRTLRLSSLYDEQVDEDIFPPDSISIKTNFGEYVFICTSVAFPEQYTVINKTTNETCGYIRLRWGNLRCDYPDCGIETVFEHEFLEEPFKGQFTDMHERLVILRMCLSKIKSAEDRTVK